LERMKNMYFELKEISEQEATKLYRLARIWQKRNCCMDGYAEYSKNNRRTVRYIGRLNNDSRCL
jgi:hypothetical protein